MKKLTPLHSLALATTLLLSFNALGLPSLADDNNNLRNGLPGRRISGGVRLNPAGSCFTDFNQSLVAMIPRNNLGKTAAERPAFWFSIPATSGLTRGEFTLFNEANEVIYSAQIETPHSDSLRNLSGLSEFKLPKSAPALTVNENYRWVFSLACEAIPTQGEAATLPALALQGWVHRVELSESLASQLSTASAADRVSLYAAAGLWHEQITELANLHRNNPSNMDVQLEWVSLVQANGLTNYVSSRIADTLNLVDTVESPEGVELSATLDREI